MKNRSRCKTISKPKTIRLLNGEVANLKELTQKMVDGIATTSHRAGFTEAWGVSSHIPDEK